MTFSNGQFNPHPLANPFNTRLGPANYSMNQFGSSYKNNQFNSSKSDIILPDSEQLNFNSITSTTELTVPNQIDDIPIGMQVFDRYAVQNKNLFVCADGTIIDIKTRKIVKKVDQKNINLDYRIDNDWHDNHGISQIKNDNDVIIDQKLVEYWKEAEQKTKELENNMTDLQKQLLADLENGKIIKKSKFIDEK